jgi:DNA-binding response OmpR family regulator
MTVVIIDGTPEPAVGRNVMALFEGVVSCASAAALPGLLLGHPSIVVTSWPMDTDEAIARTREVAASGDARHILVVLSTGDEATVSRALAAGADDYTEAPCDVTELVARLRPALRSARGSGGSGPVPPIVTSIAAKPVWRALETPITEALTMMMGAVPPPLARQPGDRTDIAATVTLADAEHGLDVGVGVLAPATAAAWIAEQMLGDASADRALLEDLVGELSNIATGAIKTALAEAGLTLTTRIPRRHGPQEIDRFFKTFAERRRLRFGGGGATIDVMFGLRWRGNRRISVPELREDMVIANDLNNTKGMLLVARGTRVTERLIDRICSHLQHVRGITVDVCEV